jgi:putative tryptophan/tyrosine transport system substrate-binding protein
MRRREFIAGLGGAAAAWPLAARAQQPAMPVVGFLNSDSPETSANGVAAFRKGLSEMGYVEGRNVAIEFRWGQNDNARLPELAADLVRRRVAVIATPGSAPGALAAKAATTTIPIVFSLASDPVQIGLVASFNRPGGNVTGISSMNIELGAKRLGLLHELIPGAARFAMLVDPTLPSGEANITGGRTAAAAIGRQIEFFNASTNRDIDAAFASLAPKRIDALLITTAPFYLNRRVKIVTLATRHAVPAIYGTREFADIGGLMSYGTSQTDIYRQVGLYTGRILNGEKPADLPVVQPTTYELIINLKTAKALGLTIPETLLATADEVIQ